MTFDYEQKKLMAIKAMQTKPNANDYRVPTSVWSGYGFSQTIPHISSTSETSSVSIYPRIIACAYTFFLFPLNQLNFTNDVFDNLGFVGTNLVIMEGFHNAARVSVYPRLWRFIHDQGREFECQS